MKRGNPGESALSKKKLKKRQPKVGLIPFVIFLLVIIAIAALVIPLNVKLEGKESARAVGQNH